jgi:hypothetical protein
VPEDLIHTKYARIISQASSIMDGDVSERPGYSAEMGCGLTSSNTDRRLCLGNGIISIGFYDGARYRVVLLRSPKSEYSALIDLAQYDDCGSSYHPGMITLTPEK